MRFKIVIFFLFFHLCSNPAAHFTNMVDFACMRCVDDLPTGLAERKVVQSTMYKIHYISKTKIRTIINPELKIRCQINAAHLSFKFGLF